jgi:hypothetical protein
LIFACTPAVARASDDIRIFVNGIQVFSDVPPQSINGRTMVPIRAVSEALGAEVTWDNSTRSVKITDNNKVIDNDITNNETNKIALLKLYTKIASHYYHLGELNDQIVNTSRELYLATSYHTTFARKLLDSVSSNLEEVNKSYESLKEANQQLIDEANRAGININDTNDILLKYNKAINQHKVRIYSLNNSNFNYNNPGNYSFTVTGKEGSDAAQKAFDGYKRFYDLIQNLLADAYTE